MPHIFGKVLAISIFNKIIKGKNMEKLITILSMLTLISCTRKYR